MNSNCEPNAPFLKFLFFCGVGIGVGDYSVIVMIKVTNIQGKVIFAHGNGGTKLLQVGKMAGVSR